MKTLATATAFFLLITGLVQANTFRVIESQTSKISIPPEAREYSSEKDLIDALCYQAKFRGGEGVARLEALSYFLEPALQELGGLDIEVNGVDLKPKATQARQRLEEICVANSVEAASLAIDNYISFVEGIRNEIQNNLKDRLLGVERRLQDKGQEIKQRLEKEIGKEAERMAAEAEKELRAQGEQEGLALKSQIEQLAKEFESFMSGGEISLNAAKNKARELSGRISTDSETRAFLSTQFEGVLSEAIGLTNQVMSGAIDPSQIQVMIAQNIPNKVENIRSFMVEKYKRLGRQKEEEIRKQLEEKAKQIAGEERERLQRIGKIFENFEEKTNELFIQNMTEWQEYEQKFLEKKKEIIIKAINSHFEQAKKLIESKKEQIDLAIKENVAEDFGILSYEGLIKDLEKDRTNLVQEIQGSELDSLMINKARDTFEKKWNEYREKMEVIELNSPKQVIDKIIQSRNWRQEEKRMRDSLNGVNKLLNEGKAWHDKTLLNCRNNPNLLSSPARNQIAACVDCQTLNDFKKMVDFWNIHKGVLERAIEKTSSLNVLEKNPPSTITEALKFRDELVKSLKEIEAKGKQFNDGPQQEYNYAKRDNYQKCLLMAPARR